MMVDLELGIGMKTGSEHVLMPDASSIRDSKSSACRPVFVVVEAMVVELGVPKLVFHHVSGVGAEAEGTVAAEAAAAGDAREGELPLCQGFHGSELLPLPAPTNWPRSPTLCRQPRVEEEVMSRPPRLTLPTMPL